MAKAIVAEVSVAHQLEKVLTLKAEYNKHKAALDELVKAQSATLFAEQKTVKYAGIGKITLAAVHRIKIAEKLDFDELQNLFSDLPDLVKREFGSTAISELLRVKEVRECLVANGDDAIRLEEFGIGVVESEQISYE